METVLLAEDNLRKLFKRPEVLLALRLRSQPKCSLCTTKKVLKTQEDTKGAKEPEEKLVEAKDQESDGESAELDGEEEVESTAESDSVEESPADHKKFPPKNKCSLDNVLLFTCKAFNEQKGKCQSCTIALDTYQDMGSATNFRFRIKDPNNCPVPENISCLICVPCENLLGFVRHDSDDFEAQRYLLFRAVPRPPVRYTPHLLSGQSLSYSGVSKSQLRDMWNAQGGLSGYRLSPDMRKTLLPYGKAHLASPEQIAKFVESPWPQLEASKVEGKKRIGMKQRRKNRDDAILKSWWQNPHYLFFLVPLYAGKDFCHEAKLFPPCTTTDEKSSFSVHRHTLVASLLLRLQGSLSLASFLIWAVQSMKKVILQDPDLPKKRFPKCQVFPKHKDAEEMLKAEVEASQAQEILLSQLLPHGKEQRKLRDLKEQGNLIRQSPEFAQTKSVASAAFYKYIKTGAHKHKPIPIPDVNMTVDFKLPAQGKLRRMTPDYIIGELPKLLIKYFPSLDLSGLTEISQCMVNDLWSRERRGYEPPEWKMSWKQISSRKRKQSS